MHTPKVDGIEDTEKKLWSLSEIVIWSDCGEMDGPAIARQPQDAVCDIAE